MAEAIAFVCVTAKSPDVHPTKPALAFAQGAKSLGDRNGPSREEQSTDDIERAFEEEIGSRFGGFSFHTCTRFSDTRYVCEGSGTYAGAHYDRLWDAEVAPDGTVVFTPK